MKTQINERWQKLAGILREFEEPDMDKEIAEMKEHINAAMSEGGMDAQEMEMYLKAIIEHCQSELKNIFYNK